MGQTQSIDDTLLDMKLQSKTLARQAEKYLKKSKQQKGKIKAMSVIPYAFTTFIMRTN